jgi:mannose-6-phosphate isomerase-like protein (cupin superfamily)
MSQECRKLTVADGLAGLREGRVFATLLRRGSLEVEFFKPVGVDNQRPHAKDEIYVVVTGSSTFTCGAQMCPVEKGEVLFVPAGAEHRFSGMSEDFATWAIFYGPEVAHGEDSLEPNEEDQRGAHGHS